MEIESTRIYIIHNNERARELATQDFTPTKGSYAVVPWLFSYVYQNSLFVISSVAICVYVCRGIYISNNIIAAIVTMTKSNTHSHQINPHKRKKPNDGFYMMVRPQSLIYMYYTCIYKKTYKLYRS